MDALLADLGSGLNDIVRDAAEAMNRTRSEIERSIAVMDGHAHPTDASERERPDR
jgi:hypothetical protein